MIFFRGSNLRGFFEQQGNNDAQPADMAAGPFHSAYFIMTV